MSRIINQNTEPLFIFDMPDDHLLSETISVKGEKGERGDPTKLSDLENDEGFITVNTDELANYYTKTATDNLLNTKLDKSTFNALEMPSDFFTGAKTISDTGSSITLSNTANTVFASMLAYGNTSQSGTPTPSTPVGVQVATGLQTVTISGDDPQEYTIDLGDLELCQIGDHKDYIYKDGDVWYKHKAVNKAVLDGSADEGWITSGVTYRPNSVYFADLSDATTTQALSNMFTVWQNTGGGITTRLPNLSFGWATTGNKLMAVRYDASESLEAFKALLASAPMVVYYELTSASDEEITDATLIAQLDVFAAAKSCNGTTSIAVTGDLPIVLAASAYKNNWDGSISGINASIDAVYNKTETKGLIDAAVEPYNYPYAKLSMSRIYRELNAKNFDGLSTYDNTASGASCIQGGVSTGDNKMLFTYWNSDNADINENKIVEKNILTGAIIKEVDANYGWCNGLAYNPDKGLVYVVPRGRSGTGGSHLKEIVILNYDDLSYIETITLNTDKTIQSAYYANGELWVMAEGAKKFYQINTDDYSVAQTITTQIPSTNSDFYYQNFAIANNKFYIIGSLPHALYVYNMDGSFFRQYDMPKNMNGVHAVGELQFIDHIDGSKFYIGSTVGLGTIDMAQVATLDLNNGYINATRSSSTNTPNGLIDIYVDQSSSSVNPDGSATNPFKEIGEACFMENRNTPARVYIADGEYAFAQVYGCNNYRFYSASDDASMVSVKGFSFRYCHNVELYKLTITDSDLTDIQGSVFAHSSKLTISGCVIESSEKYGVYLQELAKLNILAGNSITSALSNVYVDYSSELLTSTRYGITYRKAGGSKVNVPMALFASEQTCYLGDFNIDTVAATWYAKNLFSFINIDYTYKGTRKVVKFPSSLNQVCITDSYIDGSGNSFIAKCYVSVNSSSKISMSNNNYVQIANNSGTAAITKVSLADNASGSEWFIAVKNIYVSDN